MLRSLLRIILPIIFCLVLLYGCVTPLPSTFVKTEPGRVLDGPVMALAGNNDLVAAVTASGLFLKKGDGPWIEQEVPQIKKWDRVTCLAVDKDVLYLGSDGEGLQIYSEGMWEVKTSRYGGLADDGVLSLALEQEGEGLKGSTLWVGTREGVAALRNGEWRVYRPEGEWLAAMIGKSGVSAGKVYVGPGFKLGIRGEDSSLFRPPVTAIGLGAGQLVLGNNKSRIAVISEDAYSVLNLLDNYNINSLVVDGPVIWAGTDKGLLWGGLKEKAEGKPWPTNKAYVQWSGKLFITRNSQPFEYRWKMLGYNSAGVVGLEKRGDSLWVAYRSESREPIQYRKKGIAIDNDPVNPVSIVRRFVNINEYITRRQPPQFENYGLSAGIKGKPTVIHISPDSQKAWVGTMSGLWELEQ